MSLFVEPDEPGEVDELSEPEDEAAACGVAEIGP